MRIGIQNMLLGSTKYLPKSIKNDPTSIQNRKKKSVLAGSGSANPKHDFGVKLEPRGAKQQPKEHQSRPKATKMEPQGYQLGPNKRVPKGSQGATKMHPKSIPEKGRQKELRGGGSRIEKWIHFGSQNPLKIDAKTYAKSIQKKKRKIMTNCQQIMLKSIPKIDDFSIYSRKINFVKICTAPRRERARFSGFGRSKTR